MTVRASHSFFRLLISIFVVLFFSGTGCGKEKDKAAAADPPASSQAAAQAKPVTPTGPELHIDPVRTWQYVKDIVAIGPRWDGSKGQTRVGEYIHAKLKNDHVEEDAFVAETPAGKISMRNIVAKFPGTQDGIIVLGSHIDTNYPLRNTTFVGANDGASTTGLLLGIADQLRGKKLEGYSIWLAFLDGEESIPSSTPGDLRWVSDQALYGSRHLAAKWQQDGTAKKIKAFILADMIGDKDLDIQRESRSTVWLVELVRQAAKKYGYEHYFFKQEEPVDDDHIPFVKRGVPAIDIIDIDYGPNDSYHHTAQDTIDKVSAHSLTIDGDVFMETIRLIGAR